MKTIVFNRDTYPISFKKCKNLGELISWVEAEGEKQDLFVTKMYLNNKPMDEEEENFSIV